MTQYLIAKDTDGKVVAKRATLGHHSYKFATRSGSFHTRRDLVPAGVTAFPVQEISAAEYRALVRAKTEDVARLRQAVANAERKAASYPPWIAELELLASLDPATLPTRVVDNGSYPPLTQYQVGDVWHLIYSFERAAENLASVRRWQAEADKTLANYRKRLAAAERKAAKA
jgi:hypothetical protein